MVSCELLEEVFRQNKKASVWLGSFVVLEFLLLVPPHGSAPLKVLGFAIMMVVAATLLNRYFWIRMFQPFLQLAGAAPVVRGSGERCYCCLCEKRDGSEVCLLRALFVLVCVVIYAVTLSAPMLDRKISTINGEDPNPWIYFSFQWAGGFVLLLVSAWLVDLFLMTARVLRYYVRRFRGRKRGENDDIVLPLWAFPSMWFATFLMLVSVASVHGTKDPVIVTVEVPLANLPPCLDGYSLAMISDIHVGPTVGRPEVARHVAAINALGADAIVLVGDLVDDQVEDIGSLVEPVSGFSAPDGQFFAFGNHEVNTGEAKEWGEFVAERGFTVLKDTRVTLPPGAEATNDGCYFYLAGVNDFASDPDYAAALDGRDASIATVLLAHQPVQVNEASDYSVGLQLSGHTHGGQVFPYHGLSYLVQGYVSGLHKKDDTFLYVSQGAVGWGPRMRLLSTTEYTLVILRSPQVFSDADLSATKPTRTAYAAVVLFLLSLIYCVGYPVVKAFRRARGDAEAGRRGTSGGMLGEDNYRLVHRRAALSDTAS